MPRRLLPNSNPTRNNALKAVNDMKAVTPPADVPLTPATVTRFDAFYPTYKTHFLAVQVALSAQSALTNQIKTAKQAAAWIVADFIDAMQNAVRRGKFDASVRGMYGLPVTHPLRPAIETEQQILSWGEQVHDGETARIAAGGAPITFPSLAEVDAAVTNFKNLNLQQAAAKSAYDNAQETLQNDNTEADKLILKLWNEIEAAYDTGDKPSTRRKARDWGVVYIPNPGEAPSPEDYSIQGTVSDATTGNPLAEVAVLLNGTDVIELTDAQGSYLIPVQPQGTYNLTFYKNGYVLNEVRDVAITPNAIVTVNAALQTAPPTGTITGKVIRGGVGVSGTVSIDGYPVSVVTDGAGNYTINDAPSGNQNIRAYVNDNPGNQQTQTITVPEGGSVNADFNF